MTTKKLKPINLLRRKIDFEDNINPNNGNPVNWKYQKDTYELNEKKESGKENESHSEDFFIDKVVDHKVNIDQKHRHEKAGERLYRVSWPGYKTDADTLELTRHLPQSKKEAEHPRHDLSSQQRLTKRNSKLKLVLRRLGESSISEKSPRHKYLVNKPSTSDPTSSVVDLVVPVTVPSYRGTSLKPTHKADRKTPASDQTTS